MKPIVSKLSVLIPGEQAFAPQGEGLRDAPLRMRSGEDAVMILFRIML
jgi:hypothetical protein